MGSTMATLSDRIVEQAADAILAVDAEGRILRWAGGDGESA
jgi:hypothetical protein